MAPVPPGNRCVIVRVFARAMTPCLVACWPVHRHNPARVRRVAGSKPARHKTFAVSLDAAKYRGPPCPQECRWTPGKELVSDSRQWREAPGFSPLGVSLRWNRPALGDGRLVQGLCLEYLPLGAAVNIIR